MYIYFYDRLTRQVSPQMSAYLSLVTYNLRLQQSVGDKEREAERETERVGKRERNLERERERKVLQSSLALCFVQFEVIHTHTRTYSRSYWRRHHYRNARVF